ncbi:hypothetical protein D3C80_1258340 [compost metagenome]
MVGATVQVLLPGPVVLERHQLVEVGAAVDHALFVNRNTGSRAFQLSQAFGDVELVQGSLGTLDRFRVIGGYSAGFQGGNTASVIKLVDASGSGLSGGSAFGSFFAFVFVEFVPAQHGGSPA